MVHPAAAGSPWMTVDADHRTADVPNVGLAPSLAQRGGDLPERPRCSGIR